MKHALMKAMILLSSLLKREQASLPGETQNQYCSHCYQCQSCDTEWVLAGGQRGNPHSRGSKERELFTCLGIHGSSKALGIPTVLRALSTSSKHQCIMLKVGPPPNTTSWRIGCCGIHWALLQCLLLVPLSLANSAAFLQILERLCCVSTPLDDFGAQTRFQQASMLHDRFHDRTCIM